MVTQPINLAAASLRERKKRATRAALRRAAVQLVNARGLAAVTVDEIAARAGVSTRTFFNYFPSKEDALSGMDPSLLAEMVAALRRRPARESAPVALCAVLLEAMTPVASNPRDLVARLQLTRSDPHLLARYVSCWTETERQLVEALAERRGTDPRLDSYAALVVATSMAAARVALLSWCERQGRVSLRDELVRHLDTLAAGLLIEPVGPAEPGGAR